MNKTAEELLSYLGSANNADDNALMHYGTPRHSGRYPWGSGEDPYQHESIDFLGRIDKLKSEGWTETPENIKKEFGLTTSQYRMEKSIANNQRRILELEQIKSMKSDGLSNSEIARKLGINESSVRSKLNAESELKMNEARKTADFIKQMIDEKGMIEVGVGTERDLGISKEKLNQALYLLEREGYPVYKGGIPQVTNPNQQSNQKVICPPGTEHKEIYNFENIHALNEDNYISRDNGETYEKKFTYPASMDSSRIKVLYADEVGLDGKKGIEKDGLIELRRNVDDLSLGESRYSQVRILIDGKMYAKGMAVYSDNIPDGYDMVFNTNRKSGAPLLSTDPSVEGVFKKIKKDPDNPFGSFIKDAQVGGQYWYTDKDGNKKLGLINKRSDEGDWSDWADTLPSQFLAKQSLKLINKQLDLAKASKYEEYEKICELTNPTIKKHLLSKFADECDAAAVDLKAASLPGQKYHVIIPMPTLKDTEVYAPTFENGTQLALVRYPHGGTFEIPIVTVNNKNKEGRGILGTNPIDAVGINSKVAERLSGADFDGDTVMCIPTNDKKGKVKITSTAPLKGLEGFDPKTEYGPASYKDRTIKYMRNTGNEMGKISNLITDMTLLGASSDELARAVRHSMVVIDAEKHNLDYKKSELDNDIASLRKKYQGHENDDKAGGASTIFSRAKGQVSVDKRQGSPRVNQKGKDWYDPSKPEGALVYNVSDKLYYTYNKVKKDGTIEQVTKKRSQQSTKMAEATDAMELVSRVRHPKEIAYANYANAMKALANKARLEVIKTKKIEYSPSANKAYAKEVASLYDKLNTALLNAPRERDAQRKANVEVKKKIEANPEMSKSDQKKARQQALTKYRESVGSVSRRDRTIKITDNEWNAIQSGAISENKLKQILNNADVDELRQRATPKTRVTVSAAQVNRMKALSNSNYTLNEIAAKMGLSVGTVSKYLKGEQ